MGDNGSSDRLRDRAQSEFEQRRQQAQQGSTRLRDRADSVFQQRREQAQRAREAIAEQRDQFGDALGIDGDNVEPVQLDDRGEEFGFVPDESGRGELAADFAADRPFVEADDALVDADPVAGVRTRTDPDAKDDIAARARGEVADEAAFAEPDDFEADVGPGGVESVGLTDTGARRRAGRQFEAETPLETVDPDRDVTADDDGFGLTDPAQRRVAAREFESGLEQFGRGELDPSSDIRDTNGGFGLAEGPTRQVAADQLDEQIDDTTVRPGDIELEDTGDGFEAIFEREVRR